MSLPNCSPSYAYRPSNFVASSVSCYAPYFAEHRSRLVAGNAFFRSKSQGPSGNTIAVECVDIPSPTFNIYVNNVLVRSYSVLLIAGGIADLRAQLTNDPIPSEVPIEMMALGYDIYDTRTFEDTNESLVDPVTPYTGLATFPHTLLSGGSGGPTTSEGLSTIRTGPERTIFILSSTEDAHGTDIFPPSSRRVQQWNGVEWISYCNLVQGTCPGEGTC